MEIKLPNGDTIPGGREGVRFHEVVFDGERVYDAITGPGGMLLDD